MNVLSLSSISEKVSLFKIIGIYLQNISRNAFLRNIETIYHGENFLMIGTNNNWIEQDLRSMEDTIECSNQTVTAFFL